METDVQAVLRSMGESLVLLSARALGDVATDYLPAPADMSSRGSVHTFHPKYTVPGPNGTRITKTASTWAWRFHYRGKPYQGANGYETAKAAREAGEIRKAELRAGQEEDWRKLTVAGIHAHASARRVEWDASTAASFDIVWKRLFRFFLPTDNLASIDDTRILEFVAKRQKEGAARNTIRLDLSRLRAAMNIAHRKRLLPWMPEFPVLKPQRREQTVAPFELRQIVAEMPDYYRLFFAAAEEMGWRARSELRTRKWEHVDFGPELWTCCGRAVTVDVCACGAGRPGWVSLDAESSKTDMPRRFPMTRRLRGILQEAKTRSDAYRLRAGVFSPWVFGRWTWSCACKSARGRPKRRHRDPARATCAECSAAYVLHHEGPIGNYRSAWEDALRRLGIEKLPGRSGPWSSAKVPHDVRRTAIRRMRREGVDREVRKNLVGHESDSAHEIYEEKTDLDAMRAAAMMLDQARQEAPESNVVQLDLFRRLGRG